MPEEGAMTDAIHDVRDAEADEMTALDRSTNRRSSAFAA
jgi:hypothetical protein